MPNSKSKAQIQKEYQENFLRKFRVVAEVPFGDFKVGDIVTGREVGWALSKYKECFKVVE